MTFVNPEPLALFADVIAAGEGESLIPDLVEAMRGDRAIASELLTRAGAAPRVLHSVVLRRALRGRTASIAAFEPQAGHRRAGRRCRRPRCKTTDALDPPATSIFTPDTEFGSRFLIEVVRGCANLCRFCWAGYNYLPVRAFPADRILAAGRRRATHSARAGLVSIALCDHPEIERILRSLLDMGYSISPASLRLDDLTPPIVQLLRESGERSITIAPETGSDRLRRVINKTVTNEEILDATELIFANGIENLKLYYMIGLPTETDDDLVAIRDLTVQHARDDDAARPGERGRVGRIVGSVNPLIPKPGTAYQWLPMEDPAVTERKSKRLRQLLAGIDNVYFNIKSERHSYYQALLSLGDRRVAPAIEAAERNGGNWRAAVAETGVDADFYIFRDRSPTRVLPWDIIDGGMKASFFKSEFDKGLREEWTLPPKRQKENAPPARARQSRRQAPIGRRLRAPRTPAGSARGSGPAHVASSIGRSSAKLRRSPLTEYWRAGKVTLRPVPVLRSQIPKPISFSPSSGPSVKCSSASASLPGGFPLSFGRILIVMTSPGDAGGQRRP